jgi:hypothetical protein
MKDVGGDGVMDVGVRKTRPERMGNAARNILRHAPLMEFGPRTSGFDSF